MKGTQEQKNFEATMLEMERNVLNGVTLEIEALLNLPLQHLSASPLLSSIYGERLAEQGNYLEAIRWLTLAIKGLAAQGLERHLLGAMSALSMVHLRTGNFTEARTLLLFLYEEYRRKSAHTGMITHALAIGHFLLGDSGDTRAEVIQSEVIQSEVIQSEVIQSKELLLEFIHHAFNQYLKDNDNRFIALMFDAWSGLLPNEKLSELDVWVAFANQRVLLRQVDQAVLQYVEGMRSYHLQRWNMAAEGLTAFLNQSAQYKGIRAQDEALARVFRFRALMRLGANSGRDEALVGNNLHNNPQLDDSSLELEREYAQLIEFLDRYESDVELRFYTAVVQYEWHCHHGRAAAANDARRNAQTLHRIAEFPHLGKVLYAMKEVGLLAAKSTSSASTETTVAAPSIVTVKSVGHVTENQNAKLRVFVFDRLQVVSKGQQLEIPKWQRQKTRELWLLLLIQPNYSAPRDKVAELLFGDTDPKKMANRLYVSIHELKRAALAHWGVENIILVKEGVIRLSEDVIDFVDVEQYLTLIRVGEQLWNEDRELAVEMFEKACHLYGELAPDLPYIDWLDSYRSMLLQKQTGMTKRIAREFAARGRLDEAEVWYEAWLQLEPLQEEANAEQIALLIKTGRTSEARQAFSRWEQLSLNELGMTPPDKWRRLWAELK